MNWTVLAVDDQPANLRLVEACLLPEGYRVLRAGDGQTAFELCRSERPDLVLLDLLMPGLDGFQLLHEFRRVAPDLPVIIVTALADRDTKLRGLAEGASDFLVKPVDRAELLLRVRNLLRIKELASALARESFQRTLRQEVEARQSEIARELHDTVGSSLTAASLLLETVRSQGIDPAVRDLVSTVQQQVQDASERVRQISRGIMPAGLEAGAFVQALEQFAEEISGVQGVECRVACRGDLSQVPASTGAHLYRIVQEAAANALRHGRASRIHVSIVQRENLFRLTVSDNGAGCDAESATSTPHGLGLRSIRARASAIKGEFLLRVRPAGGCKVQVCWPRQP
jgi:signal transduction histidine kinase